ncbi:uncharacterized protein LOC131695423 [Topomyia yanbarensis]|uniref:uncharacterized protein LOC131694931 n=1 Tax=Topomyia yanbarensis TaxID=2498891 RepID=UPI00273A95C2|nr:uncharacterized protein LOC131694931 [Topomyia yanbarensis]XP_058839899.1 uncharacterized protein LOC131695423 [Topomyia yanbarensis]
MVAHCSASFCQQELGAGIAWFLFPPDHHRKRIWMERLQVREDPQRPYMLACRKHFSEAQFHITANGKKLISEAVPDMFVAEVETDDDDNDDDNEGTPPELTPVMVRESRNNVCRFCLKKDTELRRLFSKNKGKDIPSPKIIWQTLGIDVRRNDSFPDGICGTCIAMINGIKVIRRRFQENDRQMHADYTAAVEEMNAPETPSPSIAKPESEHSDVLVLEIYENNVDCDPDEQLQVGDEITVVEVEDLRYGNYNNLTNGDPIAAVELQNEEFEIDLPAKRRRCYGQVGVAEQR